MNLKKSVTDSQVKQILRARLQKMASSDSKEETKGDHPRIKFNLVKG